MVGIAGMGLIVFVEVIAVIMVDSADIISRSPLNAGRPPAS